MALIPLTMIINQVQFLNVLVLTLHNSVVKFLWTDYHLYKYLG